MSSSLVHHVEMCVADHQKAVTLMTKGYKFTIIGQRKTPTCCQTVLKSGSSVFIVTKRHNQNLKTDYSEYYKDKSNIQINRDTNPIDINNTVKNDIINPIDSKKDTIVNNQQFKCDCKLENGVQISSDKEYDLFDLSDNWTVFCCGESNTHTIDSVFNVALEVKNVAKITENVRNFGGTVIKDLTEITDSFGSIKYSIVKSCCGNIVHTLIDKSKYTGSFLPSFQITRPLDCDKIETNSPIIKNGSNDISNFEKKGNILENLDKNKLTTHMDHVTFVCWPGKSTDLITWYEKCFGMKRFITNRYFHVFSY